MTATTLTTPNTAEIEHAWWNITMGELGIDHDRRTAELAQAMVDYLRTQQIVDAEGEPINHLPSADAAARVARAFSELLL